MTCSMLLLRLADFTLAHAVLCHHNKWRLVALVIRTRQRTPAYGNWVGTHTCPNTGFVLAAFTHQHHHRPVPPLALWQPQLSPTMASFEATSNSV